MVLLPKQWKSRSSPGFAGGVKQEPIRNFIQGRCRLAERRLCCLPGEGLRSCLASRGRTAARTPDLPGEDSQAGGCRRRRLRPQIGIAGWSSPVAREAHNLEVAGSNPVPATTFKDPLTAANSKRSAGFSIGRTFLRVGALAKKSGWAPQAVDARLHAVALLRWLEGDALPSHHQAVVLRCHVAIRQQAPALRPPSARAGAFRRQRRSPSAEHADALRGNGIEGRNVSGPADAASSKRRHFARQPARAFTWDWRSRLRPCGRRRCRTRKPQGMGRRP